MKKLFLLLLFFNIVLIKTAYSSSRTYMIGTNASSYDCSQICDKSTVNSNCKYYPGYSPSCTYMHTETWDTPGLWNTFAYQQGGFWDTQQWVSGDFNGDGITDLAKVYNDGGYASIDVHLSNGQVFTIQRWATRQGAFWDSQKWISGDFNGDGKTDIACVFNDGGYASIDVHLSTGNGFVSQRWATRQGGFWDAQKWMSGDFNGDGRADLANVFNDNGYASIDAHMSVGYGFVNQRWATRQGGFWDAQKWMSGDFNGDGRADLANVFSDNGYASIDVHLSNGYGFGIQRWATYQGGFLAAQKWMSGDFNGGGIDDLAKSFFDHEKASLDVHLSDASKFPSLQRIFTCEGGFWDSQKWISGDFNGDGKDDVARIYGDGGYATIQVYLSR